MADNPTPQFSENPPPGRYGSVTVFENFQPTNLTAKELTWPIVAPRKAGRSTYIDGPTERGNATEEELTWPIVAAGEVIAPSRPVAPPVAEATRKPTAERSNISPESTFPLLTPSQVSPAG